MRTHPNRKETSASYRLPVFFTPRMVATAPCSPSAAKPPQVIADWKAKGLSIQVHEPAPVTPAQLALVHDASRVAAILACEAPNGFGTRSRRVASSLPYTSGSMLSAARHALLHGGAACSPTSGFHHAGFGFSGGYCTFNGLMVTAAVLRAEGLVRTVGIIDCDLHHGNGTADIIERLDAQSWVRHFTAGSEFGRPDDVERFFRRLVRVLESMKDCDILLYQAGADAHEDDPYGGWMSADHMRLRDAVVFETARSTGLPVVWNLAGGYQQEPDGTIPRVLALHEGTARECIRVFGDEASLRSRQSTER